MKAPQSKSGNWALLSPEDILARDGSGDVYIHRFRWLKTPWFSLYSHDLREPDLDPFPHSHPWVFYSLVLRGGYVEQVFPDLPRTRESYRKGWTAGSLHRFPLDQAHRILYVLPKTKSLVLTGRRTTNWGFWTDEGWKPWWVYLNVERSS